MFYSIDRIEEEVAVCIGDDESVLLLTVDEINGSYQEGSIIFEDDNGYYSADEEDKKNLRRTNLNKTKSLFDE